MSFFHIVVETSDKNKKHQFIKDIECVCTDIEEIKDHVIRPYVLKKEIYVDGSYLGFDKIKCIELLIAMPSLKNTT